MDLFGNLGTALFALLEWQTILAMVAGVILGILGGAMPGISPSTAVALLVPFSYNLDARLALILLVSIYQAANYGGAITAVLINTPGTPSTAATCFDGYPLTQQGKAGKALSIALLTSCIGGVFAAIVLILFCVPLARVALKFSPAAYFGVAIFGLATVASLGGGNVIKAIIAVLIGLLIETIGLDPISGVYRFTFGSDLLYDGFSLIPALLGLFAVGAVFEQFAEWTGLDRKMEKIDHKLPSLEELWSLKRVILQSSLIGTIIWDLPRGGSYHRVLHQLRHGQADKQGTREVRQRLSGRPCCPRNSRQRLGGRGVNPSPGIGYSRKRYGCRPDRRLHAS